MPALTPYIRKGLAAGEQCLYVADDQSVEAVTSHLEAAGIDVAVEARRGALQLWDRGDWRQPGEFSSAAKAAQIRHIVEAARAAGFAGVRFAVEMTWTLGPDIDP